MIKVTKKNRKQIMGDYCNQLLDNMDFDALYCFAFDMLVDSKRELTNTELQAEITEYYPELLEND